MKSVVVGTAGHIDHGKSALVRALTGTDPDRLKEEKARGITIDLGFAHQTIGGINFAFVDVPGHERFVKNMLAGVGGIDLVVLIVAADESVMPQTREHFDICRLLRVPAGFVALTKSDLVDEDTIELVRLEVRDLVAGSFLDGAPIVPVSSRTGAGLNEIRQALLAASGRTAGRPVDGAARLPIDRVFSMKGFGTVVTGTLVSGRIAIEDELTIAPAEGERRVKVRGLQVHGERRTEAVAGQRTAVNLGGVDVRDVERGQVLAIPGAFEDTRLADAAVEVLAAAKPLKHGARVRFHQGTAEILGRVALVGPVRPNLEAEQRVGPVRHREVDAGPAAASALRASAGHAEAQRRREAGRHTAMNSSRRGATEVPPSSGVIPAISPGSRAYVRLRLERPALLARGDRYILRAYSPSVTIAGGVILDPRPPRTAIRTAAALERCRGLDLDAVATDRADAEVRAAAVLIEDAAEAGLPIGSLMTRVGISAAVVNARIDALIAGGDAVRAGAVLVAPPVVARLKQAIVQTLTEHHRTQPLSEGVPREELRERVFGRGHADVFERALTDLLDAGTIAGRDRLALASHRVELSPEEARARGALERAFRDGGLKPPDVAAIAAEAGVAAAVADRMIKLLLRQKVLVRVDTLLFHEDALKRLKAEVSALKTAAGAAARIDVGTFKDRFGVTRKFAIPLLEYLDRERVTRRVGDARVVL